MYDNKYSEYLCHTPGVKRPKGSELNASQKIVTFGDLLNSIVSTLR